MWRLRSAAAFHAGRVSDVLGASRHWSSQLAEFPSSLSTNCVEGRVDDVINVSGHRIGTAEVEGALTTCQVCTEAAVVPMEHPIKGQGIYAFVSLMEVGLRKPSGNALGTGQLQAS